MVCLEKDYKMSSRVKPVVMWPRLPLNFKKLSVLL